MAGMIGPIPAAQAPFPNEASLCESCGYHLHGLSVDHVCPECGVAIHESSPVCRPGLPWQQNAALHSWLVTTKQCLMRPRQSFRRMRVGGSNGRDRVYLGTFVIGLAVTIALVFWLTGLPHPWLAGLAVLTGILAATYVEAVGVAYFSQQKGWRMPFRLAERIACYASVGWVPAVPILVLSKLLRDQGLWQGWVGSKMPSGPSWSVGVGAIEWVVAAMIVGVSILWFEILVYIGMRQAKYANA